MNKTPVFNFTYQDFLDPSAMIPYNFICGLNEFIAYEFFDGKYICMDSYCVNPKCDCTRVLFKVMKKTNLKEIVTTFHYDYVSGKIIHGSTPVPRFIVEALESHAELNDALYKRSQLIREAFFQAYQKWKANKTYKVLLPKIGRNDPCTCGSGKKSKKCCGA